MIGGPVAAAAEVGAVYREIKPSDIEPNPRQPRQVFDEEALSELVHSIRELGVMQPIVVRETRTETARTTRWGAALAGGAAGRPRCDPRSSGRPPTRTCFEALLENIHRAQLNPLEEAAAYQQLLDEFAVTHEELADRIGRSRPVITNMIRLLRLPVPVQRRVAAGVLSAGHARALLALDAGAEAQEELPHGSWQRACRFGQPKRLSRWLTGRFPANGSAAA